MEEKSSKDSRNPSNILVVTFLYLITKYPKIQSDPLVTEVKLRITLKASSQINRHVIVKLKNNYSLSFYFTREQIGLCLWPASGLCVKEGTLPLINSEMNTVNQLSGGHNWQYFEGFDENVPFINQVKNTIFLLKTISNDFVNHKSKNGINISRDSVLFVIEHTNCCIDHSSGMIEYFDNHILPYVQKNKVSSYPM